MVNPPSVVLRQGTQAILSYLRRLLEGAVSGHFDLRGLGLTEVPSDITQEFTLLTSLDLSGNKIAELPPAVQNLTNMVVLALDGNPILDLQPSLGCITSLRELRVDEFQNIR
jgi:hypothetical protein